MDDITDRMRYEAQNNQMVDASYLEAGLLLLEGANEIDKLRRPGAASTHTAPSGRDELRHNATMALAEAKEVTSMLLCGQILTLLDDIDILIEALKRAGIKVLWQGQEMEEPRLGNNLKPMGAKLSTKKGGRDAVDSGRCTEVQQEHGEE